MALVTSSAVGSIQVCAILATRDQTRVQPIWDAQDTSTHKLLHRLTVLCS